MIRFASCILAVVALAAASWSPCGAKSYRVERVRIDAAVRADGSVDVTESNTYVFDGSFTFAYREIPLKPGERIGAVSVSDEGIEFVEAPDERPGSYRVSNRDGTTRIVWHYRAKNQRKTFTLRYTIYNVIHRYNDTAEFYCQFVGADWDRPIGDVAVRVHMPEGVRPSDLRAWAHGPLHGRVEITPEWVMFNVSPLPARTFWEGRVLCSPDVFASLAVDPGGDRLAVILAEEAAWAQEANARREAARERARAMAERARERRELAGRLLPVSVFAALAGLGVWFLWFRRYGWPRATRTHVAPGEIPSDHRPAVLSYLMSRSVSGRAVVATLVDLANRGYVEIRETEATTRNWLGKEKTETDYRFESTDKPRGELAAYERNLLDFMMAEAGDDASFSMSRLKRAASKNPRKFRRWFARWSRSVSEYSKGMGFFEPYPAGAMFLNAVCGAAILAFGIVVCIKTDSAAGIPAVFSGVVQAVLTVFLTRRTPEGQRLQREWSQFKTHLRRIGGALGPVTLDSCSWAAYLASAIVFGMHKKLLPKMQLVDDRGAVVFPAWFYGIHGDGGAGAAGFEQSFSNLASGFSGMVESVTSTVSSASGAGGGASVGGGGGSGGGGGGAG